MEVKIAVSLLNADYSRLEEEIKIAEDSGADMIHWDIMDGHFVPTISFGPMLIKALGDKTKLPFNCHLMIENPENFIKDFAETCSANITVHAEACPDLREIVQKIKGLGKAAGVAINPSTPLSAIEHVLDDIDFIVIMTVVPGFGGQKFMEDVLPKIREARQMVKNHGSNVDIWADGGVNEKTAPLALDAGANVLVIGSAFYGRKTRLSLSGLKDSLRSRNRDAD